MLFNSVPFLIFFPVVTLLFFLTPQRLRWCLLLAASCFFYMFFKPVYILILAFTITLDYFAGLLIERETDLKKRRKYLAISIIANLGVLAVFKYLNFFTADIAGIVGLLHLKIRVPHLRLLLPIGLSFHTFQAMAYNIEVYRGNQKAERHFGIYALYVLFYPQLVAGPIERPQNLIHQFRARHHFTYDHAVTGLNLIAYGLFKKMVVADRLSVYVGQVYSNPAGAGPASLFLACFFFAIQIYCDFSGYSDIALGAARVMGFSLMNNFNHPFASKTIGEFWRRWHISLSSWFNDYLFAPMMALLRHWGKKAVPFSVMVTFLLCGLWHGADWKFIIFGGLQGVAIAYEFYTREFRKRIFGLLPVWLNSSLSICLTFSFFAFTCIFFRAKDLHQALAVIRRFSTLNRSFGLAQLSADKGVTNLAFSFAAIGLLAAYYLLAPNFRWKSNLLFLFATISLTIILGTNAGTEFIYFQF